jgi:hypothetical protein
MHEIDSRIKILIEKPLAKEILKLLVDNDLSIPQMIEKIQDVNTQTLIAFLTELQRFGLIELTDTSPSHVNNEKNSKSRVLIDFDLTNQKPAQFPYLGIPVNRYNQLWEDLSKENDQINIQELENSTFTIPDPLKHLFKEKNKSD